MAVSRDAAALTALYPRGMEETAPPKPMVLLANEPRSYRQAIAGVLCALRPHLEVFETEQAALDRELRRGVPGLVICSRATPAVRLAASSWVELYTEHGPLSSVSIRQEDSSVDGMEMPGLLRIVDRVLPFLR